MKRALILVIALAGLMALPTTAGAASWKGTVAAKDTARKAVVIVSKKGVAKTVRTPRAGKFRVGQRVAVRARELTDGTYAANRIRVIGRTAKIKLRGVVVRSERSRVVLSAGGSVFAVSAKAARHLAHANKRLAPGERVLAHIRVKKGKLHAKWFKETGYADLVELEGIYLATADGVLELAVVKKGRVFVTVPLDLKVPDLVPGDKIELLVRIGEDGAFTLVALREHGHKGHKHGVHYDDHEMVTVYGTLGDLSDTSVGVQPGEEASPVTCANPAGVTLPGFALGMDVRMYCHVGDGGELVLYKLYFESDVAGLKAKVEHERGLYEYSEESDEAETHVKVYYWVEGMLTSLEPPTVPLGEGLEPLACAKHQDELGLLSYGEEHDGSHDAAVGDKVGMSCYLDGDSLVLMELEVKKHPYEYEDHAEKHDGESDGHAEGSHGEL